jgi:hypothetical protein
MLDKLEVGLLREPTIVPVIGKYGLLVLAENSISIIQ